MGVMVCVVLGDNGFSDGMLDCVEYVDFFVFSLYVLVCGGISVCVSGNCIEEEIVWNDGV